MIKLDQPYSLWLYQDILISLFGDKGNIFDDSRVVNQKWYWKYITRMDRIGEQSDLEVQFYVVEHRWLSDPRVSLTKEIFRTLSDAGHRRALVAIYHPDSSTWRISLVTMTLDITDSGKLTREYSNARRYSFLLWENEKVKTPTDSLLKWGQVQSFDNLMERFSVEVVRKKFFDQYVDLFVQLYIAVSNDTWLVKILQDSNVDQVKFTKNLLWKIIFIYFIQKKGWLGLGRDEKWGQGDKNFMRSLWERFASWDTFVRPSTGNFYNDYLEHLFYNGFNKDRRDDEAYEPNMRMKVPYLNGGLFKEDYRNWEHVDAKISNDIFSNSKNTGILDIFDIYNFTIDEDDLFDSEIAVDPEMLWKIFEKMISVSRDNIGDIVALYSGKWKVEINTELNKKFGAYYTPREIVHYITRESIVAYLVNWLSGNREENESKVRFLIYSKDRHLSKKWDIENESELELLLSVAEEIDVLLQKMKILDPAVGSGAFPMGILHEVSTLRYYLHSEGFCMTHHHEDEEQTEDLTSDGHISMYRIKRDTIKNSIYGVDIEPGAIDIARLRFWLSLVVDAETPEPLPNFEFKFVCANTLIPLNDDTSKKQMDFGILEEANMKTVKRYKREYYNADKKIEKIAIAHKLREYTQLPALRLGDIIPKRSLQIDEFGKNFDNSNHSHSFFDSSLMLSESRGFDIIIGNPPYSGISTNKGEWITAKIEDYKYINGEHFWERKHWLQDDYVKFIRLAESFVENKKTGIVSYIVNHGFIDNPTFRAMRWHLLGTFDYIHVIDLHGNSKKKETTPYGGKDENVFDIQQWTAIFIWVKTGKKKFWELANLSQIDLYGRRCEKFTWLQKNNNSNLRSLSCDFPYFFYSPKDFWHEIIYSKGFSVAEIFPIHVAWIITARDWLVIADSREELLTRMKLFFDPNKTDDFIRHEFFGNKKDWKYLPGDSRWWRMSEARKELRNADHNNFIREISFLPFTTKFIYYHPKMVDWSREKIFSNLLDKYNLGLMISNQVLDDFRHIFISDKIVNWNLIDTAMRFWSWNLFPLYLYNKQGQSLNSEWVPNLDNNIMSLLHNIVGEITPEEVLYYIYAILHSTNYRNKYKEFLKIDFPKIPYPISREYFLALAKLGEELRWLHLLESGKVSEYITQFPIEGLNTVETPKYAEGKVYINKSQYFSGVPESVWNFPIGGYLPAQKWLKDRKGRGLSDEDIAHYQSMIVAMSETIRIMKEIDIIYSGADNL